MFLILSGITVFVLGRKLFFWQQEPLASSAINYYRLSLHPKSKPIKSAITRLCTKLGMCTFDSVKCYLNITDTMYISWDLGTKSVCALQQSLYVLIKSISIQLLQRSSSIAIAHCEYKTLYVLAVCCARNSVFWRHSHFTRCDCCKPPVRLLLPEVTTRVQCDVKQQAVTLPALRNVASPKGSCTSASP